MNNKNLPINIIILGSGFAAIEALKKLQFLVPFRYSINNNEVKIIKK